MYIIYIYIHMYTYTYVKQNLFNDAVPLDG